MKTCLAMFLSLCICIANATANEFDLPKGDWSFKTKLLQKEIKYVLNFANSSVSIIHDNKKIVGPSLKIDQNKITADFGFGEGMYILQKKSNSFFLCDAKKIKDCQKLKSEKSN